MKKLIKSFLFETLPKFLFLLGFNVLYVLEAGFVLSKLWLWFIVPKFASVPMLSYLDATGVMLVVYFFLIDVEVKIASAAMNIETTKSILNGTKPLSTTITSISYNVVMMALVYPAALLFAYVWHRLTMG